MKERSGDTKKSRRLRGNYDNCTNKICVQGPTFTILLTGGVSQVRSIVPSKYVPTFHT